MTATEQAGKRFGLQIRRWQLPSVDSFEAAFQGAAAAHVDAVDVLAYPFFNANRERLGQLAAKAGFRRFTNPLIMFARAA